MEMNLDKVFSLLMTKLKYIIVIALIFAFATFGYTKFFVEEKYTSSAKFLVVMDVSGSKTSEANFVKEAIHSYLEIFNTTKFFNEVADEYNAGAHDRALTASGLKSMTSVQSASNEDAPSFTIKVTSSTPEACYDIASIVASHIVEKAYEFEALNKIEMIDDPIKPLVASSPNIVKNTILGLVLGAVISVAFFICKEMFDKKIKNLEDLTANCDIPILGVIPDTETSEKNKPSKKGLFKGLRKENR